MFRPQEIGVDVGAATVSICVKGKGIVLREPSVVALVRETGEVRAVGDEAYRLLGQTPGGVVPVRPLRDGVVADYGLTEKMLGGFLRRVVTGPPWRWLAPTRPATRMSRATRLRPYLVSSCPQLSVHARRAIGLPRADVDGPHALQQQCVHHHAGGRRAMQPGVVSRPRHAELRRTQVQP